MLAHAEFEYYFEERSKEVCAWATSQWSVSGQASQVLVALGTFFGKGMGKPSPSNPKWRTSVDLSNRIGEARTKLYQIAANNNGVKEQNILMLLLPVGLTYGDFDSVWLADINTFGENRGNIAHTSASVHRITAVPNPFDELNRVNALLAGTKLLDEKINRLMQ